MPRNYWQYGRPTGIGYVTAGGHNIFYKSFGPRPANTIPLLVLHGGPGFPHDYLLPLARLAKMGRSVIFYDQLGCGESQRPRRKSEYSLEQAVKELVDVRAALGLDRVHLLGHSYGAILSLQYALTKPRGLESLILASGAASVDQYEVEARRLITAFPGDALNVVLECEEQGTTDSAEYERVNDLFGRRHGFRGRHVPACYMRSREKAGDAYEVMWGPSEFTCNGKLKGWSVVDRLSEIKVPTLVTCGRYDESTPRLNRSLHRSIWHSRLRVFPKSAHMPHLEEPDSYLRAVRSFLLQCDLTNHGKKYYR